MSFEPKQKQKTKGKTMNAEIYLIKNERNAGPYSESEVMARVKDGRYAATDLAWYAGCTGPVPLIDILCNPPVPGAISPEPTITKPVATKPTQKARDQNPEVFSADDLRLIAENYKNLLLLTVGWLIACFIPWPDTIENTVFCVILGAWIRFGWRLSAGLRSKPWVWVIWSLIPLGNFYALVRILCTAARTLKSNGIPVGILGADRTALARLSHQERP